MSETNPANIWEKVSRSDGSGSVFSAHTPALVQGPQSLPAELVSEAQREVRRLQELRRYIQEECDQLLLRKERLKEEVVLHSVLDGLMCFNSLDISLSKRGGGPAEGTPPVSLSGEPCMQISKETSL